MIQDSIALSRNAQAGDPALGRSVFEEDWWLDSAAPGAWGKTEVRWDNVLVGEMPFHLTRNFGLRLITMPPYTRFLEPRIFPPESKPVRTMGNRLRILRELTALLPPHKRMELCLKPGSELVFPFACLNHAVTHSFTFQVADPGADARAVALARMDSETRNLVKSAGRKLDVEWTEALDRFERLAQAERDRRADDHRYETLERIWSACVARDQGRIVVACNDEGRDVAAAVCVWDRTHLYYWLAARDPYRAGPGAARLLFLECMLQAASRNLIFDADGFVSPQSASIKTKFGLTPIVRPFVNKAGRLWKLLHAARIAVSPAREDRFYRV